MTRELHDERISLSFADALGMLQESQWSKVGHLCSLAGINLNFNAEIFMILLWFTESLQRCEWKLYDERELWRLFSSRVRIRKICFKSDINLDFRIFFFEFNFCWWTRTAAIKRNFSLFSSTLLGWLVVVVLFFPSALSKSGRYTARRVKAYGMSINFNGE